ncbi:MAG: histidine kinase N-terminal domain-containing protein [Microbacteriaceae bacterium]|nr:histidine kinase N-terminal domain-containing protein [Microbacteriaceae bacterium]
MSSSSNTLYKYTQLDEHEIEWIDRLVLDWPLLADLALSDAVLWAPTTDGRYIAINHSRPTGLITMFHRDVIGDYLRDAWRGLVDETLATNRPVEGKTITWYEEAPMQVKAYPVSRRDTKTGEKIGPFAVLTLHTPPNDPYAASPMGLVFRQSASDLFEMISSGDFPSSEITQHGRLRGEPRATDGLIRVLPNGDITFASPNTLTSFARLGYRAEMENENLPEIVAEMVTGLQDTNESLPLICAGKISARSDIEVRGRVVTARSIPVIINGKRVGAIILTRDVTDIRRQAQALITKNATIREIHHRVKNNLQTVASLLRVQARRAESDEAKHVLGQAMRRVDAIAVVHDTLATGLDQIVQFDQVFERVLGLATEVASLHNTSVEVIKNGTFGEIPSAHATPLALALTEIVTNAVEHGMVGMQHGRVTLNCERDDAQMRISVIDNGRGIENGRVGQGLGTQIVRTLIEGELSGHIEWGNNAEGVGARVDVTVPLLWLLETKQMGAVPGN